SRDVVRILNQPTRNGGVKVYDSRFDQNNDGVPDKYVHMKTLMISGHFGADTASNRVYTGSQNWTTDALRSSDEVVLEVDGAGAHAQYAAHFDFVRQTKTRPVSAGALQLQLEQLPTFSDELPEPN
ncbi:MAG: phospholipase D-like domain-containing protein, partial [Nocardioidaceae bacterium]